MHTTEEVLVKHVQHDTHNILLVQTDVLIW